MDIERICSICPELDLSRPENYQLVRFIPMVAVMMADGKKQAEEVEMFYKFVDKFIKNNHLGLSQLDARRFFAPLMQIPVSDKRKQQLEKMSDLIFNENQATENKGNLVNACMEIAAAATIRANPLGAKTRISAEEQAFLLEIIRELGLGKGDNASA